MRKSIKGTIAAAVVAVPLTLTMSGIASADTYGQTHVNAGAGGVDSSSVTSTVGANDNGGASYHKNGSHVGPDGVSQNSTNATSGGNSDNGNGGASFNGNSQQAGPNGASSDSTHSSTGGDNNSGDNGNTSGHGGLLSSLL